MKPTRLSVFPLGGALLFPRMQLPLHIFEPRYRAMITDSLARDRRIGMIQPRDANDPPTLFDVGCVGRIADVEALPDGRFDIVLEGLARFTILRELDVTTSFRQVEAELEESRDDEFLSLGERA
jgi:Lon protease-like protein